MISKLRKGGDNVSLTVREWMRDLESDSHGNLLATISNISKIIECDEALKNIVFNELNGYFDVVGPLPWREGKGGWGQFDFACLELYLEQTYGIYAPARCKEAMSAYLTTGRRFHPIRKYLEDLEWDGVARLDTMLVDYFDAADSHYVRMVTRKTLTAAVARIYEPGIKFDHVLVLCGAQGIGKSTLFSMLGKAWYSDSMTIADMKDKTACEKLQGTWIMEIGELAGLRKVDVEIVKSFVSRQTDTYRPAYGQFVENHKRACIVVGTTNAEHGFLRDITGNRRFWPVKLYRKCGEPWRLSQLDIEQIWAEARYYYLQKEALFLSDSDEADAEIIQRQALEVDPRAGLIEEYLSDVRITSTCLMELWCECLGRHRQDMKKRDAYEIEAILCHTGEWELYSGNASGKMRTEKYGVQRLFVRKAGGRNGLEIGNTRRNNETHI